VFFNFYSSTDLLYVCFAVLHPLLGLFFALPPRRASNAPFSVRHLLARDRFYFPVFLMFLLVISLVSISLLWGVMLDPDLWVVDVNVILAFGSRRTNIGLRFLALSVKK
jgi:ABC-type sugar transport system permease subunit